MEFDRKILLTLFDGRKVSPQLDFSFEKEVDRQEIIDNVGRLSLSGVQEKLSAVVHNGSIRLAKEGEQGRYILKPAPLDYSIFSRKQVPINEYLTMQIAQRVYGIRTAANGLCFDADNQPVYITRRFDVFPDGSKLQMEDLASILGKNEQTDGKHYKYEGCYEDIALAIQAYIPAWPVAMERFFKLVIFNYIFGNGDAHLKNFSMIMRDGDLEMAPAYDLLNTSLHINGDDFALNGGLLRSDEKSDTFEKTGHPSQDDFDLFGSRIGLSNSRRKLVLSQFLELPQAVTEMVRSSLLDDKLKRTYLRIVAERTARFRR